VQRIGVLMGFPESDSQAESFIAAFREGLQKLGWTIGRNVRIDTRWATPAEADSMQRFAKELVALQPDLILSHTTPTTAALLLQTRTIPIIFATVTDPVGSGFVAGLCGLRPCPHRSSTQSRSATVALARQNTLAALASRVRSNWVATTRIKGKHYDRLQKKRRPRWRPRE
jgi:hypothetical protein